MGQGTRRLAAWTLTVALIFGSVPPAQAWGPKGHRLVGEIARQLLSVDARAAVRAVMGSDDLATFALYLDIHKDELDEAIEGSRDWHYDDIPVCGTAPHSQYCPKDHCASSQIPRYRAILSDPHQKAKAKRFAIRVLTHLIGDIHQPLHAADNHDVGGNQVFVLLPGAPPGTEASKLHGVWDSTFVNRLYGGKDEGEVASKLIETFKGKAASWQAGSVSAWISESHTVAVDLAYKKLPGFACGADLEHATITLPDTYVTAAEQLIPELLAKGGFRLAFVLNRALQD